MEGASTGGPARRALGGPSRRPADPVTSELMTVAVVAYDAAGRLPAAYPRLARRAPRR